MTKLQQFQKERSWLFYRLKGITKFNSNLLTVDEYNMLTNAIHIIDHIIYNQKKNYDILKEQKDLKYKKK